MKRKCYILDLFWVFDEFVNWCLHPNQSISLVWISWQVFILPEDFILILYIYSIYIYYFVGPWLFSCPHVLTAVCFNILSSTTSVCACYKNPDNEDICIFVRLVLLQVVQPLSSFVVVCNTSLGQEINKDTSTNVCIVHRHYRSDLRLCLCVQVFFFFAQVITARLDLSYRRTSPASLQRDQRRDGCECALACERQLKPEGCE